MWRCAKRAALLALLIAVPVTTVANAQESAVKMPTVIKAVAPEYPVTVNMVGLIDVSGLAVVLVQVDKSGAVIAAKVSHGSLFVEASSVAAAKLWKFAPAENEETRTAELTFIFRTMPTDTPVAELGAVFHLPNTVEIRRWSVEAPPHRQKRRPRKSLK
jgi:TonB family protein